MGVAAWRCVSYILAAHMVAAREAKLSLLPDQDPIAVHQHVQAVGGFAYGVAYGDMHVFQERGPVYFLDLYRPAEDRDLGWLIQQPSRLLLARHRIVEFVGRDEELASLAAWRDSSDARSATWLFGPGGQGKTRLADEFARTSQAAGWKVVTAVHGLGSVLPSQQSVDLSLDKAAGLLLIVDYADRWPQSHLVWLLNNSLLRADLRCRVLLVARTIRPLAGLSDRFEELGMNVLPQRLDPVSDGTDRRRMFTVARDRFAACYGLLGSAVADPPADLAGKEYGLVLALHMAALVAVDARSRGEEPPADPKAMSAYLLNRERSHWTRLHENRSDGLACTIPPEFMARATFAATLCGPLGHRSASRILLRLGMDTFAETVLNGHAACYPAQLPERMLEPLYPDRLAEDFIALCLPGHDLDEYAAEPWGPATVAALVADEGGEAPEYIGRAMGVLAAAAARWPHVKGPLSAALGAEPRLAVDAGGASLIALADPDLDLDLALLARIADQFPPSRRVDLDLGMAAITAAIAPLILKPTDDETAHLPYYLYLHDRLEAAGDHNGAAAAIENSVRIARKAAARDPGRYAFVLAVALHSLGMCLLKVDVEVEEAIAAEQEAVNILRQLASNLHKSARRGRFRRKVLAPSARDADACDLHLAVALDGLSQARSVIVQGLDEDPVALSAAQESVRILEKLSAGNPGIYERHLATSLVTLGNRLRPSLADTFLSLGNQPSARRSAGDKKDAGLATLERSVEVSRRVAASDPGAYQPYLVAALATIVRYSWEARDWGEVVRWGREAVEVMCPLAEMNPAAFSATLAGTLRHLTFGLMATSRYPEALEAADEGLAWWKKVPVSGRDYPALASWMLLTNMGELRRMAEGLRGRCDPGPGAPDWLPDPDGEGNFTAEDRQTVAALKADIAARRDEAAESSGTEERPLAEAITRLLDWFAGKNMTAAALPWIQELLQIQRRSGVKHTSERDPELRKTLARLVLALLANGRRSEALAAVKEAMAVSGPDDDNSTLSELAEILAADGD
jgi:tetratricopeptide (TPR) repeat protein